MLFGLSTCTCSFSFSKSRSKKKAKENNVLCLCLSYLQISTYGLWIFASSACSYLNWTRFLLRFISTTRYLVISQFRTISSMQKSTNRVYWFVMKTDRDRAHCYSLPLLKFAWGRRYLTVLFIHSPLCDLRIVLKISISIILILTQKMQVN